MKKLFSCIFLSFVFITSSCQPKPRTVVKGFYNWKSELNLYDYSPESKIIDSLNIKRLYVRMFDVDWSEYRGAIPISISEVYNWPDSVEFVPVVFITNKALQRIADDKIEELANKIYKKISARTKWAANAGNEFGGEAKINEIQLDCDWTESTKQKYFSLVQYMRKLGAPSIISVTLRLHQYKYPEKTGVPPADKALLMFYNMTNVNDPSTQNSILDNIEAEKYLKNAKKYPLKLDVALPIFSWGVAFRDKKFLVLLNDLSVIETTKLPFLTAKDQTHFTFNKDTVWRNIYFRFGDEIRVEEPAYDDLKKAAELTSEIVTGDTVNVVFYHLSDELVSKYGYEKLEKIYSIYR